MSTRDRARFGLLYLYGGRWGSIQIIPEKWIAESTKAYSKADPGYGTGFEEDSEEGFGYMWWASIDGRHLGNKFKGRPYSARGYYGQYIVVIPEKDLVVVQAVDHPAGDEINEGKSFNKLLELILAAKIEGVK